MTVAFIAQVPEGPAREVLDVVPLMMNHQDTFIAGATWACLKSMFPNLPFDRFWWTKISLYDKKNQVAHKFSGSTDLTERQAERELFGSEGPSSVLDDIDDEDAMDFIFGEAKLSLGEDGVLKIPKPEPLDTVDNDRHQMYRARVLEGDLPIVSISPVPWELVFSD